MSAKLKIKRGTTESWQSTEKQSIKEAVPLVKGSRFDLADNLRIYVASVSASDTNIPFMDIECNGVTYNIKIKYVSSNETYYLLNGTNTVASSTTGNFSLMPLSIVQQAAGTPTVTDIWYVTGNNTPPITYTVKAIAIIPQYNTIVAPYDKFITIRPTQDNCYGIFYNCKAPGHSSSITGTIYFKDSSSSEFEIEVRVPTVTEAGKYPVFYVNNTLVGDSVTYNNWAYLPFVDIMEHYETSVTDYDSGGTTTEYGPTCIVSGRSFDDIDRVEIDAEFVYFEDSYNIMAYHVEKDTTLEPGQLGVEYTDLNIPRLKVGDGTETKDWIELPYLESPSISTTTTTTGSQGTVRTWTNTPTLFAEYKNSGSTNVDRKSGIQIVSNIVDGDVSGTNILPYVNNSSIGGVSLGNSSNPFEELYIDTIGLSDGTYLSSNGSGKLNIELGEGGVYLETTSNVTSLYPNSETVTNNLGTSSMPWDTGYIRNLDKVYQISNSYSGGTSGAMYSSISNIYLKGSTGESLIEISQTVGGSNISGGTGGVNILTSYNIDTTGDPGTAILPYNSSLINRIGSPSSYWSGVYTKTLNVDNTIYGVTSILSKKMGQTESYNPFLTFDVYNGTVSGNQTMYYEAASGTAFLYSTTSEAILGMCSTDPIFNANSSGYYDPNQAAQYSNPYTAGFINRLYSNRIMSNDQNCRCGISFNQDSTVENTIKFFSCANSDVITSDYDQSYSLNLNINNSTPAILELFPSTSFGRSYLGNSSSKWTAGYINTLYTTYLRNPSGTGSSYSVRCQNNFIPNTTSTSTTTGFYLGNSSYKWLAVYAYTGTIQTSDRSAKSDIKYLSNNDAISIPEGEDNTSESYITMSDVVDFVKELEPATFCYKDSNGDNPTEGESKPEAIQLGLIADDICNSKLFKYVGVEDEIDDILEPEEIDEETGEVVKEAVIADEKKTVRGLQPIPLATAALATCKYLLSEIEGLKEELEGLRAAAK